MISVLLAISVLYLAREIFVPLALALLFGFLLMPLVKRLESWHVGRGLAVGLVITVALTGVGLIGWSVTNQLIDVVSQIPAYKDNIRQKLASLSSKGGKDLVRVKDSVQELGKELAAGAAADGNKQPPAAKTQAGRLQNRERPVPVEMVEPPSNVLQAARDIAGPLLVPLGTALVVIVFTAFILLHQADLRNRLIRLTAPRDLNLMTQALDDATERVSKFLFAQFIVNLSYGIIIATGLYFIGLPNALLWGVLAGSLRFIPYLGPMLGSALPLILALAVFPGWKEPMLTFGLFAAIELAVSNFIEPWAYGTRTGISPLAILIAAVFWTILWGPLGLILSTPLTVCVVVLGRYVPQLEFLYVLLGDEPVMPPEAQFYQRLLAMDNREAREVALEFLKKNGPLALYDAVILPALAMAEEDRHKDALDQTHEEFIVQSVDEFILEVPQITAGLNAADDESLTVQDAVTPKPRNILFLAAADKADEIVSTMLAQVLESSGHTVTCLPVAESRSGDLGKHLKASDGPIEIVVISALPPFALLSARTLSKRVHAEFPRSEVVIGLWRFSNDTQGAAERLGKAFTDPLATTLADAVAIIETGNNAAEGSPTEKARESKSDLTVTF